MAAASVSSSETTKSGWLFKRGGMQTSWKKRWCVLSGGVFKYYADEKVYSHGSPAGDAIFSKHSFIFVCWYDNDRIQKPKVHLN
jgi:hypothetical protein